MTDTPYTEDPAAAVDIDHATNSQHDDEIPLHAANLQIEAASPIERKTEVVTLDAVTPQPVSWYWPGYLPRREVVALAADTEMGKSTLCCWLAAVVSVGGKWPDGSPAPSLSSLIISGEESPSRDLRNRLDTFGADVARIGMLPVIDRPLDLHVDQDRINRALDDFPADLVFLDPVAAVVGPNGLGSGTNLRHLLGTYKRIAEERDLSIIFVLYVKPGRGGGKRALDQFLADPALAQMIRVAWTIADAPDDDRHDAATLGPRRIFAVAKSNLAQRPPALEFSRPFNQRIIWYGPSTYDIDRLATQPALFQLTPERQDILDTIRHLGHPVTPALLEQQLVKKGGAIRKLLHVMERAGQVRRVAPGYYDDPVAPTYQFQPDGNNGNGGNTHPRLVRTTEIEAFITHVQQQRQYQRRAALEARIDAIDFFDNGDDTVRASQDD